MHRKLIRQLFAAGALTALLSAGIAEGRSRRRTTQRQSDFAYYLLSLSYAPDFCAQPAGDKDPRECGPGKRVGFVVHGLWPQSEGGRGPEHCGNASPVAQDVVSATLGYIPTESLIQHEWAIHGTCSGLNARDYFAAVRKARDLVAIPQDLQTPARQLELTESDLEAKLAAANPKFPKEAIRVSCYRDGELQEVRVCFDKNLSPRGCGASAGQCPVPKLSLRPVR